MKTRHIFSSFLFLLFCYSAFSWGETGHRAIGEIAQSNLTKKANKKITAVLNGETIAEASTWMDEIRSDSTYNKYEDWHWVTIPDGQTYANTEKNTNGDVIYAINFLIDTLKKGVTNPKMESEYLKMLIHLVGDIHQPLHVGKGDDKGGNTVGVTWFGERSNLHRVWDSEMINSKRFGYTELATLLNKVNKDTVLQWQSDNVLVWASESMGLRQDVYTLPENHKLGYEYMYHNWNTVKHRLTQAGIRLAGILNDIYN
ncbi:MAG: S1/P1 nuclease [Bacteroidia bacterium]